MPKHHAVLLLYMLSSLLVLTSARLHSNPQHRGHYETYDFIIVGGGTSGCVVATRLSKFFKVLLIEAGSWPGGSTNVPGLALAVMESRRLNYRFQSKPQKNAGRAHKGVLTSSVGKMLGGSSSHNHGIWERGNPKDYDRWAEESRDESWSYENLQKYFKKIENREGTQLPNDGQSGQSGHLNLIESSLSLGVDVWLQAGKELGYKIRDPAKPQTVGFNRRIYSSLNGQRASSYTAYLEPILGEWRNGLKVLTKAHVTRILFNKTTAIGVKYKRGRVSRTVFASKEVILAASAMLTPIILFQSGIGPKDQVQKAKAPAHIADLPVGRHMQDHSFVAIQPIYINNPRLTWRIDRNLTFRDYRNYKKHGEGPLTTTYHGAEAFILSDTAAAKRGSEDWPDLQILCEPTAIKESSMAGAIFHVRPNSRGVITINPKAKKVADRPIIDYKFYDNPSDMDALVDGINFFLRIMEETTPFKKLGARLGTKPYRSCQKHQFRSREYWKCYIRFKAHAGFHTVGTCRMGHGPSDPKAVVDSKLRVIGINRLRVVDASVMPHVPNANTYAPTMVIAEKAADEILKDYQ